MSTSININDHDGLNAAFAEKVAGWVKYEAPKSRGGPMLPYTHLDSDGMPRISVAQFTRSMDAVLPWLEKCRSWRAAQYVRGEVWVDVNAPDFADGMAPTLPHAAVVALLMANGFNVVGDAV